MWVAASDGEKGYIRLGMDRALFEFAELQLSWRSQQPVGRIARGKYYGEYTVPLSAFRVLCLKAGLDYEEEKASAQRRAS